jgi:hypothetical protein
MAKHNRRPKKALFTSIRLLGGVAQEGLFSKCSASSRFRFFPVIEYPSSVSGTDQRVPDINVNHDDSLPIGGRGRVVLHNPGCIIKGATISLQLRRGFIPPCW